MIWIEITENQSRRSLHFRRQNMKKRITHKKVAGTVGILTVVALLLAGTFAWYSGVNQVNEFVGTSPDKEIVLHDDYDPDTGQKDVFVENTGSSSMFVRVRLDEFMDLTQNTAPSTVDWTTHIPDAGIEDCGLSNDALELYHDYFTWHLGGQKYYMPGTPGTVSQDLNDYDPAGAYYQSLTPAEQAKVAQTPLAQIISMVTYNSYTQAQKTDFIGWIYDTDGYAYWSQPLFKGDTTGLLLNWVDTAASIKDLQDYYYAINVVVEAVDSQDLDMWLSGAASVFDGTKFYDEATPDAKAALDIISAIRESTDPAKTVTGLEIDTVPGTVVYTKGEVFDPTGLKLKVTYADTTTEIITTGYSYSPAGALKTSHTQVTFKYGGKTVSQTITVND